MTFKYLVRADDLVEMRLFLLSMEPMRSRLLRFAFPLILVGLVVCLHPLETVPLSWQLASAWALGSLMLLGIFGIERHRGALKSQIQSNSKGELGQIVSWEIDELAMTVTGNSGPLVLPWTALLSWQETPELFAVRHRGSAYHPLPKRALGGNEEVEALRELLKKHLGDPCGSTNPKAGSASPAR